MEMADYSTKTANSPYNRFLVLDVGFKSTRDSCDIAFFYQNKACFTKRRLTKRKIDFFSEPLLFLPVESNKIRVPPACMRITVEEAG